MLLAYQPLVGLPLALFFCLQQVNSLKKMSKIFFHCALKHETVQHVCIKIPIDTLCISVRVKLCIFHYGNLQDIFIFSKIQEKSIAKNGNLLEQNKINVHNVYYLLSI
jgi:hypothetical protein